MTPTIRPYRDGDGPACYGVYFDAVRNGTAPAYSEEQARAWAPSKTDNGEWSHRLSSGTTLVSEEAGQVTGFITLTGEGHLDLFFVRPAARPHGTASMLYDSLLRDVRCHHFTRLTTHASLIARRFLERRGWQVIHEETATRNGVDLIRFLMSLEIIRSEATETNRPSV